MSTLEQLDGLTPNDLGFDTADFKSFRVNPSTGQQVQLEAIEFGVTCSKRFVGINAATGLGKTLIAASIAKLTGMRTVILTATKGLQEQYKNSLGKYGLVDIRGRSNYECSDYGNLNCKSGASLGCACVGGNGCTYERARDKARNALMVSANYAYWMTANDKANGIERTNEEAIWKGKNPVELLVCDEAHIAPDWLESYLSTKIHQNDLKPYADIKHIGTDMKSWKDIAYRAVEDLNNKIGDEKIKLLKLGKHRVTPKMVSDLHTLESLQQKYDRIAKAVSDDWVIELHEGTRYGRVWTFDVIWPGRYAEKYLFCGMPKVILMSATLRPKTLGLLGISKEVSEFREWDRMFPANRNPIYSIPAKGVSGNEIRIDRHTNENDMLSWVEHIDTIIDGRLDRKGIIQTVSYQRQGFLFAHSRHGNIMVGNTADPDSDTAIQVAEEFRKSPAPKILVSPSFSMGWDFPRSECEYIIVAKIPFKPQQSKVMKARENRDKQYGAYMAMQELIQSCGRGMRSFDDRCETIIVDGHLSWFLYANKSLACSWFVNAVRKVNSIPTAPIKL
jgi:Rad3-related DNA helicase